MTKPPRIDAIQAARGLAALAVVAVHANLYLRVSPALDYGVYGVDFFFVLSGFIIFRCHADQFDAAKYFRHRMTRVFVPYLPVGLAVALVYAASGRDDWSWLASVTLAPAYDRPALSVAWTLQHEVAFYVLAAAFFASGRPLRWACVWGAMIVIVNLAQPNLGNAATVLLGWQNLEFVAGMAIAFATRGIAFERICAHRSLISLGDASYAIYLTHVPAMGVLWRLDAPFPMLIALPIALGIVYHHFCERPLLALARRTMNHGQRHGTMAIELSPTAGS